MKACVFGGEETIVATWKKSHWPLGEVPTIWCTCPLAMSELRTPISSRIREIEEACERELTWHPTCTNLIDSTWSPPKTPYYLGGPISCPDSLPLAAFGYQPKGFECSTTPTPEQAREYYEGRKLFDENRVLLDGDDSIFESKDVTGIRDPSPSGECEKVAIVIEGETLHIEAGTTYIVPAREGGDGGRTSIRPELTTVKEEEEVEADPPTDTSRARDRTRRNSRNTTRAYRVGLTMRPDLDDIEKQRWQEAIQVIAANSREAVYVRNTATHGRGRRLAVPELDTSRFDAEKARFDKRPRPSKQWKRKGGNGPEHA